MKTLLHILMLLFALPVMADNEAQWITADEPNVNDVNTWIAFRRDITLDNQPEKAVLHIAADSKYWLWVNGQQVVFEGGLKRGPNPRDTYYDVVDIASVLQPGVNRVAVLLCHFGKDGFSHVSSSRSGLIIADRSGIGLNTNASWLSYMLEAYGQCSDPQPNWRLPESNLSYDARKDIGAWQTSDETVKNLFRASTELGGWGSAPWNQLHERLIPQWRDFGRTEVSYEQTTSGGTTTLTIQLPYNMQLTPWFEITDANGGTTVSIETDHAHIAAGQECIRAQYITRKGRQTYESLGWMNGEVLTFSYPSTANITVHALGYRETGYDADFTGSFSSSDNFINRFWTKALRTLYVNMRDTYFDCPDRERAQWWGDVTILMGESFYTMSPSAHKLMRKAIRELVDWQRPDGTLFSPIPASNWDSELPAQMLAAIGTYGLWTYYMHTADTATTAYSYPAMRRYLDVWQLDEDGLTAYREGGWDWVDWGTEADKRLLMAAWHYAALQSATDVARLTGHVEDVPAYKTRMDSIRTAFDHCWNGRAYRHPSHTAQPDDRVQAMAVVTGLASSDKYNAIAQTLRTRQQASPYMEKYVMEALFQMGQGRFALSRMKNRYATMVNATGHSTLYEYWGDGGSTNHAWSGGPLTVIAQHLMGITPTEPAFRHFRIAPQPSGLTQASIEVPTHYGNIAVAFEKEDQTYSFNITVPDGTEAEFVSPTTGQVQILQSGTYRLTDGTADGLVPIIQSRPTMGRSSDAYSIDGRRLPTPQHGINIINHHKTLIR